MLHVTELVSADRDLARAVELVARHLAGELSCSALDGFPAVQTIRAFMRGDRPDRHCLVAGTDDGEVRGVVLCRTNRDGTCQLIWGLAPGDPDRWLEVGVAFRDYMSGRWPKVQGDVADVELRARYVALGCTAENERITFG